MDNLIPDLEVIHQDQDILIINKPANCHSLGEQGSIQNALTLFDPNLKKIPESGLVQRLDYETSGIMIATKNTTALKAFKQLIKKHQLSKEYLLVSEGKFNREVQIENYLGSRYRGSRKVSFSDKEKERFLKANTRLVPEKILAEYNITMDNVGELMDNILKIFYIKRQYSDVFLFVQTCPSFSANNWVIYQSFSTGPIRPPPASATNGPTLC